MKDVAQLSPRRLEEILHVHGLDKDFVLTKRGIRIRLPLQQVDQDRKIYVAFLACGRSDGSTIFAIYLQHVTKNYYTRVGFSHGLPELLEISVNNFKPSNIRAVDLICVDDYGSSTEAGRFTDEADLWIDMKSVHDVLRSWKLKIKFYGRTGERELPKIQETGSHRNLIFIPRRESRRFFLVATNDSHKTEFILIITRHALKIDNKAVPRVCVRAITFGPNGDIPDSVRTKSAHEIYKLWCKAHDLSNSSSRTRATLSNGQDIEFMIISTNHGRVDTVFEDARLEECYTLWVVLRDSESVDSEQHVSILTLLSEALVQEWRTDDAFLTFQWLFFFLLSYLPIFLTYI